ncbi:hypothetical protein GRR92_05985 [Lactococcus lactis subsp. lactis]|nr:hypothetical protein [Lactococcus lactis]MBR8673891.1 hypothetical protein [Lactococcus lactis subsp. lactis]MBR8676706.1 hypothetical protein [Lactococcus lactis subsp. lactis]MBR8684192.1 hypothetical protein [Lactococcus lactis subsp. lactis]
MLDLVINLDEIGCDIIKSIFEMKNFGINQCEIRLVGNRNIAQLSEKECINLKKILDSFHLE